MKIVKLFVLLLCAFIVKSYRSGYCEICRNHTLCKYAVPGPSAQCKGFDKKALLNDGDIQDIVNRINSRRNLVAMGSLKRFPQAANMRKVRWSTELASFAQRWADQCNPSVKPNKEDDCRDLVGVPVGQNIAAVLGPTQGLTVKSFVDMWFMLKLRYKGNIVYYNQTRDDRTNYFTQLIWADTEYVGCGKVKFFNRELNTVVERVICNFAPKGNYHGKPVYALGLPATQCPKFMDPDIEYPGLCKHDHDNDHHTAAQNVQSSSVSSLLRILELSNNSAKQELDPNNLKQLSLNSSGFNYQRNQKTRNVFLNNSRSNGAIKRDSFHMQNPLNPINDAENYKANQYTPERGHSRMYHGYQTKVEPVQNFQTTQSFSDPNFRRFDLTTTSFSFPDHNHDFAQNGRRIDINKNEYISNGRKFMGNEDFVSCNHCTRKKTDCCTTHCITNQCTRGQSHSCNSCLKSPSCSSCLQPALPPALPSHDQCSCSHAPCPTPSPCEISMNCPVCPSHNCPTPSPICAKRRAEGDAPDISKTTQFSYYDLFPSMGVRSGEDNLSQRKHLDDEEIEESLENKSRKSVMNNQVKDLAGNLQTSFRRPEDLFDTFYSSERKRRDFEDQMTFKPFWQMDEFNYKRPSELKSLRYTTLGNKRNRKTRKTIIPARLSTESITIKLDDEIIHDTHHNDHITEKYLSFEELMHLRKLSTLEPLDYEARRIGHDYDILRNAVTTKKPVVAAATTKAAARPAVATTKAGAKPAAATTKATVKPAAATTKATVKPAAATTRPAAVTTKPKAAATTATTTEMTTITANTPFIRMKQCTRKLTCTWTALMMTGPDGKAIMPGDGGAGMMEFGSKTPPGYVDGCTRTSTCTRDYMDRNKMAPTTTDDSVENSAGTSTPEDEDGDYCEKRSLNVQRRNLDDIDEILISGFQEALTEMTPTTLEISHVTNRDIASTKKSRNEDSDCMYYEDYGRVKRGYMDTYEQLINDCHKTEDKNTKTQDTQNDLLYSMLRKVPKPTKPSQMPHLCPCNGVKLLHSISYSTIFFLILPLYCT